MNFLTIFARNLKQGPQTEAFPLGPAFTPERLRGRIEFNAATCEGCRICERVCPANAIRFANREVKVQVRAVDGWLVWTVHDDGAGLGATDPGRHHATGLGTALAEAVGSWAALIFASTHGKACVGVDLSITHHRGARGGVIRATATPLHLGRRVTTHEIRIEHEDGTHLATARITNLLIEPE